MAREALYYPYIHVRNVDWLKGTLLRFDRVQRMVPKYAFHQQGRLTQFLPDDSREIQEFTALQLLTRADIDRPELFDTQRALAEQLERDAANPDFQVRYGHKAAQEYLPREDRDFQIHQGKITGDLLEVLARKGLAWNPDRLESYDRNGDYVEVHPRVGQAIMSTLAIACATADGLDIVGDRRSKGLHRCLLRRDGEAVYDAWLKTGHKSAVVKATSCELFDFFVAFGCDLSRLSMGDFLKLREEREPLQRLMLNLKERVRNIPTMKASDKRNTYFCEQANAVLADWKVERKNLSPFARGFWSNKASDVGAKYVRDAVDRVQAGAKAAHMASATGTAVGAAVGAHAAAGGGLAWAHVVAGSLIGAAPGLAVGIVGLTVTSWCAAREKARKHSPYRFLTLMKNAGVVFRESVIGPEVEGSG